MYKALWLLPLLVIGCSCQKAPSSDTAPAPSADTPPDTVGKRESGSRASAETDTIDGPGLLAAVSAGATDPPSVIRDYITQLLRGQTAAADAAWQFAPPPGRADDAVLRTLQGVVALRVKTGAPQARDERQPTQLIDVPVNLRVTTSDGTDHYRGWYRLAPDPDGQAWRIHSASIQPSLD